MGWIGNAPSQGLFNGGQIVDGTVDTVDLKDNAVTAVKLSSTAIKDKLASDQFLAVPRGTTAQRPSSPEIGYTRYNTDLNSLENYTTNGWNKVSIPIPVISNITGDIYNSVTSTLTLTGFNFGTGQGTVRFASNGSTFTVNVTPTSDASLSVAIPSTVYALAVGSTVAISYVNSDNGTSVPVNKTIISLPTGGTISTNGGYRYHLFTSSQQLTIPVARSVEAILLAGGGGGGDNMGGGGGAGGLINWTTANLSATAYNIVIGAAGAASLYPSGGGTSGGNTTALGLTAIGGGRGGCSNTSPVVGQSGGSGGGGNHTGDTTAGAGTSGQGYAGGNGTSNPYCAGGGGGAGSVGSTGGNSGLGGTGVYLNHPINAYVAVGGGGGGQDSFTTNTGTATSQGGGRGGRSSSLATAATAYGSGGGGGCWESQTSPTTNARGSNGSDGIVIIRYPLPT